MKKSIIALLGLAVILGGCSNKVSYGDAQATETTTIDFGSTDLQKIAGEIYPRISDITQSILDFNDKYDCEDHCNNMTELAQDLSKLGEMLADRIELEDRLIKVMRAPRTR